MTSPEVVAVQWGAGSRVAVVMTSGSGCRGGTPIYYNPHYKDPGQVPSKTNVRDP